MWHKLSLLKLLLYSLIFIALPVFVVGQPKDSFAVKKDTPASSIISYQYKLQSLIKQNRFLNSSGRLVAMAMRQKKEVVQDGIFYTLLAMMAVLAFLRFFYTRYFNNLFRVFFNTSLRQSQLTDQLIQAKLPSLFFNIVSFVSGGLFVYFLLIYFQWIIAAGTLTFVSACVGCMAAIYLIKFFTLKFIGWVTGYKEITNTYIFIIFLINKILGILLLPFIVIMAFCDPVLVKAAALAAILFIALMFLMRFYRSYGLLQHRLKFNRLHFCVYIAGVEIVPVLLIYKGVLLLLSKNL